MFTGVFHHLFTVVGAFVSDGLHKRARMDGTGQSYGALLVIWPDAVDCGGCCVGLVMELVKLAVGGRCVGMGPYWSSGGKRVRGARGARYAVHWPLGTAARSRGAGLVDVYGCEAPPSVEAWGP